MTLGDCPLHFPSKVSCVVHEVNHRRCHDHDRRNHHNGEIHPVTAENIITLSMSFYSAVILPDGDGGGQSNEELYNYHGRLSLPRVTLRCCYEVETNLKCAK